MRDKNKMNYSAFILFLTVINFELLKTEDLLDQHQNNEFFAGNYQCPQGWVMRCEKCYLFAEESKTWTDARYYCQQRGADLVTIKDEATNFFISRYVRNKSTAVRNIFIGLNDRAKEGVYQWADGSEAIKEEFRWLPGEPQNSPPGEDCVEMYTRSMQYLWNDVPCSDNLPFVCQMGGCVEGSNRCDNGKCVSKQALCDGVNDCGDFSDEQNCTKCGGYLSGMSGSFASPNYPNNYGNNRQCVWIIEVPKYHKIELTFQNFSVEEGFDYVEVFDGKTLASKSFGKYNNKHKPTVLLSTENQMRVTLISDISESYEGFFARYKAIPDFCGEDLIIPKDSYKIISSPNFPNNYPDNKKCIWNITNEDRFRSLTMTFLDLDTEETNDIIEVRDGTEKDYVLGRFSGNKNVKSIQPIFSTTNGLWVKFQSNFMKSGKGFRALIRAGCYAEMNVSQGIVASPGYGFKNYPKLIRCTWKINEPNNRALTFIFHKFDTEKNYDVLTIKYKPNVSKPYSGVLSKGFFNAAFMLSTDQSQFILTFKSDVTYSMTGFNSTFSIGCPKLFIRGGKVEGPTHYGAKITYTCDNKYVLKNGKTRTCEYGGKWSQPAPYCEKVDCGHPGLVTNGGFQTLPKNGSFDLNSTVEYYCNAGYKLIGDNKRVCQNDSTWSGGQPICQISKCEDITNPKNGKIIGSDFTAGQSVEFECDDGFNLIGAKLLTCAVDGKWSAQQPTCKAITCPVITPPDNSYLVNHPKNVSKIPYGSKVDIKCDLGYKINGTNQVQCVAPGIWEPKLPNCYDINECTEQDFLPCKGDGYQCVNTIGSFKCRCLSGFEKLDEVTCRDVDECEATNQTVKCSQKCINKRGGYKCACHDGFFLYNGDNSTITRFEARTAIVNHTCYGVPCPIPPIPDNGFVINYGRRYPVKLEYFCDNGHVLKGHRKVECLKNQTWDKEFPKCIVASCPDPKAVSDSTFNVTGLKHPDGSYKLGSQVVYTCNKGYEQKSGNTRQECIQNKTDSFWSGKLPTCERKSCPPLIAPSNGSVVTTSNKFEGTATYKCDDGFKLIGDARRTCMDDGKWNKAKPVCAATTCPEPGVPLYGSYIGRIELGRSVRYSCYKAGLTLIGDKIRTCLHDVGKGENYWTGKLPTCKDVTPPVFNCTSSKTIVLPHSENKLLVNWAIPSVTDSTGDSVDIRVSPKITPPTILNAGINKIVYTATDKAGNNATCDVIINVQDKQIPRIKCPRNVVIRSDFPTQVIWGNGLISDNDQIAKISFNPVNGSIFESGKYHPVRMTVEDKQGNKDVCVLEVYVKGCGCESKRSCNSIAPHNGGISTCHVNLGVTSCSLTCPKGLSFVQDNFKHDNVICRKEGIWSEKDIPGCGERKNVISCLNGKLTFEYESIDRTKIKVDDLSDIFTNLYQYLNDLKTANCQEVDFNQIEEDLNEKSLKISTNFKIVPEKTLLKTSVKSILQGCQKEIEDLLKNNKANILNLVSKTSLNLKAKSVDNFEAKDCCGDKKEGYCCPDGHSIRGKGQNLENVVCLACSPGMFLNETSNHCTSCPIGYFTSTIGNTACTKCPLDSSTLSHQSVKCIKKCSAGTWSTTGLEPTCRKCDYGEYQTEIGKSECIKCPINSTTFSRGAAKLEECKVLCPLGTISDTGLQPCVKCEKGTYQDEHGRSLCKQCPSGGIYAGKEGATNVGECPSNNACDLKKCQNEATCVTGNYSYTCLCKAGFTGKHCEININECQSSPCQHNGTCTDLINDYNCTCVEGLTGKNCQNNTDDCKTNPCVNDGVCEDLINDFKCWCQPGWQGKRCDKFIDKCLSSPCQHNSTCTPLLNSYHCNCTAGYQGVNCETEIDECLSSPCYNNATCTDLINDFKCTCQPGFKGDLCAVNIDDCVGKPCQNNGTCFDLVNGYKCECQPGFKGENCTININECDTAPCLRNSTCIDFVNKFLCECEAGYYGDRCEFEIDECNPNLCQNNASCVDKVNDYECVCPFGYTGKNCSTNIDDCSPDPCSPNGDCIDLVGDYRCVCDPGYEGRNCQNLIDNCQSLPCQNNASCTNMVNNYKCNCMPGYEGKNCSIDTDDCKPDSCNGNAENCTDLINGFICYCKPGFRGLNCSEEINNCVPQPCLHNSTCTTVIETNDFHCNCTLGYEGKRCENEINECLTAPCKNGATCIDKVGKYECLCPKGFIGANCEIDIDDCLSVTCQNNGLCIDEIDNYHCQCPFTHKGDHCEKRIPDEVDIKFPGGKGSLLLHSNISTVDEFSLSIWVRYLGTNSKGVFLVLANKNGNVLTSTFLKVTHQNIIVDIAGNVDVFSLNKKINDGLWHHLFISLSGKSSQCIIALDKQVIINENKAYLKDKQFFKPNGYVLLGKNANSTGYITDDGFAGEISQFGIWSRAFNLNEIEQLANNCSVDLKDSIIPWVGLMASADSRVELIELWTCGTNVCPAGITGKFCETLIDKIPPTVKKCPPSKKVVSPFSSTRVGWDEPEFEDNVAVVKVLRSHAPNQLFTWGDYIISYIAKDAFNNSVTCIFELYVSPHNCSDLTAPSNAGYARQGWQWGIFFDFQCNGPYELAVPKPPFYSCGKMGTWSHGPPTYPENPKNLLPECTATIEATATGTNTISYSTSTCDQAFKEKFLQKFKEKVLDLHKYFNICGERCDFTNLIVKCTGSARLRRDTSPKYDLTVSFDSKFNENLTESLITTEAFQAALKDKSQSLTLNVDGKIIESNVNKSKIAEPKISCPDGNNLVKGKCALCPPGTYRNSSIDQCSLCAEGSYSTAERRNCTTCPDSKTTYGTGARNILDCFDVCSAGLYLFNGTCVPCKLGFYKEQPGFQECNPCSLGKTTSVTGATKQEDCTGACPLGQELVENKCKPCLNGYYRDNLKEPECIPCPFGTTTYAIGSTTSQCYKKCELGYELSEDRQHCIPCASGYYRESESVEKCIKCPGDNITKTYGANKQEDCIEKNGTLYDVSIRVTNLEWDETLTNPDSVNFRNTALNVTQKIAETYENDFGLVYIKINQFSEGSVVVNMTMSFVEFADNPLKKLSDAVESGNLDGLNVDRDSFKTDRCFYISCPLDQICWYNMTTSKVGCMCEKGFYQAIDGKCYVTCETGYCLNGGACVQTDVGRTCRCSKDYSGERCEKSENKHDLALILGLVFAALLIALVIAFCIRRRQRIGRASLYKKRKFENIEGESLGSLPNTPVVSPVEKDGRVSFSAVNKGAELEEIEEEIVDEPQVKVNTNGKITINIKATEDGNKTEIVKDD